MENRISTAENEALQKEINELKEQRERQTHRQMKDKALLSHFRTMSAQLTEENKRLIRKSDIPAMTYTECEIRRAIHDIDQSCINFDEENLLDMLGVRADHERGVLKARSNSTNASLMSGWPIRRTSRSFRGFNSEEKE